MMIIFVAIVISVLAIGVSLWSMRQTIRLNHELDDMEAELTVMEAETNQLVHDRILHMQEGIGQ